MQKYRTLMRWHLLITIRIFRLSADKFEEANQDNAIF